MDYLTSHTFYLALLGLYTVALVVLASANPRLVGARWFALATSVELIKVMLQSLEGRAPRVLTAMVGNEINILGFLLMFLGYRWFVTRRSLPHPSVLAGTALLMFLYAELFLHRIPYSFPVMGVAVLLLCLLTVSHLLQTRVRRLLLAARVTAALLLVHCTLLGYRMMLAILAVEQHRLAQTTWQRDPRWMYSMLGIMFVGGCLLATYLWFTLAEIYGDVAETAGLDALTGILNRRALAQRAAAEFARRELKGQPMSLVALDLDHFKHVNDSFGHGGGDVALCAAVDQMKRLLRPVDAFARTGGEEFVLLLPDLGLEKATSVAERLRLAVEATNAVYEGVRIPLTASAGVVEVSPEDTLEMAMRRADEALYQAKQTGRNRVVRYDRSLARPRLLPRTDRSPGAASTREQRLYGTE